MRWLIAVSGLCFLYCNGEFDLQMINVIEMIYDTLIFA